MELVLNLEWMVLATAMCWLWLHHARREGQGRPAQLVSLVLVLGIMFVVITMYDDEAMAQNSAETRCFQREDDLGGHPHVPFHPVVASTLTLAAEFPFTAIGSAVSVGLIAATAKVPALSSVQNRPPPAA